MPKSCGFLFYIADFSIVALFLSLYIYTASGRDRQFSSQTPLTFSRFRVRSTRNPVRIQRAERVELARKRQALVYSPQANTREGQSFSLENARQRNPTPSGEIHHRWMKSLRD